MKIIIKILLVVSVIIVGCKNEITNPSDTQPIITNPIPNNLNLEILGKNNIKRTYFHTVSKINLLTNKPVVVPPDSIKNKISFPDSLYSKGIFVYATLTEKNEINGDTLKIYQSEYGKNLFNIINSFPSDGGYGWSCTWEYFADSNKINLGEKPYNKILFEVPLKINSIYATPSDTIKILGNEQITVKAGTFYTYKIERNRVINEDCTYQSFQYIATDIGVVLFEEIYITNEKDEITGQSVKIEQYGKSELISYEYAK